VSQKCQKDVKKNYDGEISRQEARMTFQYNFANLQHPHKKGVGGCSGRCETGELQSAHNGQTFFLHQFDMIMTINHFQLLIFR
jgi:hypothetical protein